jgi:hypothetical protein
MPLHCEPIETPQWSPPGLAWVLTKEPSEWPAVDGVWILPGSEGGHPEAERVMISVGSDGHLHHHDATFKELYSGKMPGVFPFVEIMDLGSGPGLVVASGLAHYNFTGHILQRFKGDSLLHVSGAYMWPAVGDFIGDGTTQIVFGGDREWWAFRADGEQIARFLVVDERDIAGWLSTAAQREGNRDFLYLVSANEGGSEVDIYKRLHKLVLKPNPLAQPALDGRGGASPVDEMILPYVFHPIWMREFHGDGIDDEIRFYDLTGDGRNEIVLSHNRRNLSETGPFSILTQEGAILYDHPASTGGRVAIGDTNGNGVPEVVVLLFRMDYHGDLTLIPDAQVSAVEWTGSSFLELYRHRISSEYGGRFIALCDVDGDAADEILVALGESGTMPDDQGVPMGQGVAMLVAANGTTLWEYRFPFGMPWRALVIDDFTGDGSYEFIISTQAGQVLVFSAQVAPSRADYERVFDGLLARERRKPSEAQVAEWLAGLPGVLPPSGLSNASAEPQTGPRATPAIILLPVFAALGAVALTLWLRRRRER